MQPIEICLRNKPVFILKQTLQAKKNFEKINVTFLAEIFCKKNYFLLK